MDGEAEGTKYLENCLTSNRSVDHDFDIVFGVNNVPNKFSNNTSNLAEIGKVIKIQNQDTFLVKTINIVMKDFESKAGQEVKETVEVLKRFLEIIVRGIFGQCEDFVLPNLFVCKLILNF